MYARARLLVLAWSVRLHRVPHAPAPPLPLTHRSRFLNTICTDVIHLHNKTLEYYKGDYDTFER